jgi:hypothetical protein
MATELQTAMQGLSESQTALNGAVVVIADKLKDTIDSVGQADGVASLDETGKLPENQLPSQTMALIYAAL